MNLSMRLGDIVLVQSKSRISDIIRKVTTSDNEKKSWASHVGMAIDEIDIIEAVRRVRIVMLPEYNPTAEIIVVRPDFVENMSIQKSKELKKLAYDQKNKKYGWIKIFGHYDDYLISKILNKEIYLFRRMFFLKNYPICTWLLGFLYQKIFNYRFNNISYKSLTPDDVADDCVKHINFGEWNVVYYTSTESLNNLLQSV